MGLPGIKYISFIDVIHMVLYCLLIKELKKTSTPKASYSKHSIILAKKNA